MSKCGPEQRHGHRRAFDVPAGTSGSPRRLPRGFVRLRRLPQHEVERIALALVDLHTCPGPQVRESLARQPPVRGKARDRKIHVAVLAPVRVPAIDQLRHHVDDLRHVLGRPRLVITELDSERSAILLVGANEPLGERRHRLAVLLRSPDDLVVDVGNVAHERDSVAMRPQVSPQQVEHDQHAAVADMAIVVNGHTADVHPHLPGADRLERFLAAGERVVKLQHGVRQWRSGVRAAPRGREQALGRELPPHQVDEGRELGPVRRAGEGDPQRLVKRCAAAS